MVVAALQRMWCPEEPAKATGVLQSGVAVHRRAHHFEPGWRGALRSVMLTFTRKPRSQRKSSSRSTRTIRSGPRNYVGPRPCSNTSVNAPTMPWPSGRRAIRYRALTPTRSNGSKTGSCAYPCGTKQIRTRRRLQGIWRSIKLHPAGAIKAHGQLRHAQFSSRGDFSPECALLRVSKPA
jgi:hypothetical protein